VTPLEEARALAAAHREHKGLAAHHRRQARRAARALEEFCRRNDIALELVTQSREGHGHGEGRAQAH
jgi:hypothetical protein